MIRAPNCARYARGSGVLIRRLVGKHLPREDNIVSTGDFLKAPAAGWKPLVDAGGKGGLRWTSLVEMPVGRGAVLICQMRLVEKLAGEPVAQIVLENLLNYAATRPPRVEAAPVAVVAEESRLADRLSTLGFTVTTDADAPVILVDAAQPGAGPEAAALRARVEEGGTVVLHGLTPDCLERWQALLPPGTALREVNSMHALRSGEHQVLEGISATDLWWSVVRRGQNGGGEAGGIQVAYAVGAGEGAVELVAPGALVATPVGQGLLVVDQMQWEREDVHQQRSGQYIALLLSNLLRLRASTTPSPSINASP